MYLKVHSTPKGTVVALCDKELLGKVLSQGEARLDLQRHAGFYKGELVSEKQAVKALAESENANIVGEKSIAAAAKAGFDISSARLVGNIAHLQAYRL